MDIKNLNAKNFKKYGKIIEYPKKDTKGNKRNLWRIVHTEEAKVGWRIAYLVLRDKTVGRLERHPKSDETFEPISGRTLFFVSSDNEYKSIDCFLLDKPIVLNKGMWHALISLDAESEIKIVENAKVKCEYLKLPFRMDYVVWSKIKNGEFVPRVKAKFYLPKERK